MGLLAWLNKNRAARRERRKDHKEYDVPRYAARKHIPIFVKSRRKFIKMNPISDALFCEDLSYVPRRYIKGTLSVPGSSPTSSGYVAQD